MRNASATGTGTKPGTLGRPFARGRVRRACLPRRVLVPLILAAAALGACVSPAVDGAYLGPAPFVTRDGERRLIPQPERSVLVVYNHGSAEELIPDACEPAGATTPPVIGDLAGQKIRGFRIIVFAYCTPSRVGAFHHASGEGEPKVVKRTKDIERLIGEFVAGGLAPERIFVAGHSAGGWAALLAARRAVAPFNGVIAFAPAFAGRKAGREDGWWALHHRQVADLSLSERLDALVFAFEGDAYNDAGDLQFLAQVEGVDFVVLPGDRIDGADCDKPDPHQTPFRDCFRQTQGKRIVRFLEERLTDPPAVLVRR
jgi:pimeloyl-ACP methyl ester carboxylesterase